MEQYKIDRINELAHLKKERALTEAETAEQAELRKEYLAGIRASFGATLESTVVMYPDGTKKPLRESNREQKKK